MPMITWDPLSETVSGQISATWPDSAPLLGSAVFDGFGQPPLTMLGPVSSCAEPDHCLADEQGDIPAAEIRSRSTAR